MRPNALAAMEALQELAETWEDDARRISVYLPESTHATVLEKCAQDLRRVAGEARPEWVTLRAIRERTGRSASWLYRTCRALAREGKARRTSRGWEVRFDAALTIPLRQGRRQPPLKSLDDLSELAAVLGREGSSS